MTIQEFSLSTWQAARQTGLTDQAIRDMIRAGKLRSTRGVDGRYRLDASQIARLAEARRLLREALSA